MQIHINKKVDLITYSRDSICIKKGNKTLVSYKNLVGALNWIEKNSCKDIKNRVQEVLIDFSNIDICKYPNEFKTKNYTVKFDGKREFTISDLSNRNNNRWIYDKKKTIQRIYQLEINRLNVFDFESLISEIEKLNIYITSINM